MNVAKANSSGFASPLAIRIGNVDPPIKIAVVDSTGVSDARPNPRPCPPYKNHRQM